MGWKLCVALLLLASTPLAAQNSYQTELPSKRMREKARTLSLQDTAPDDLEVKVKPQGTQRYFAQFRYGTDDSLRVALVLDQRSEDFSSFDLYVDLNRDREIRPSEKIAGQGKTRDIEIPTEIKKVNFPERTARTIQFRKSLEKNGFSIKTKGGYAAQCEIDGKPTEIWRVDGNANGLFSDVEDELWIDIDGDGKWSPIRERFAYRSAVRIGETRYAVRGDQLGTKIEFGQIDGEGQLSLDLDLAPGTKVTRIRASIFGDDGSAHSVTDTEPLTLPVGKYMIGQVSLILEEEDERPWRFSFSHNGDPKSQRWVKVTKSGDTVIKPFNDLEFSVSCNSSYSPGTKISVKPKLKTGDNLYITGSGRGETVRWGNSDGNDAKITATDSGQREFAVESTGFA